MILSTLIHLKESKSQLGQDILALLVSDFKNSGTFLEIGAADGVTLSNTFLLEKFFDWSGFLCEPAKGWRSSLEANRSSQLIFDAVWDISGDEIPFREVKEKEFSGVLQFLAEDMHAQRREEGEDYSVKTISLSDLLAAHEIPLDLDYLSIDTEGSEFKILKSVDFSKFRPRLITVEHNFTDNRKNIYELLTTFGYKRCYENLSKWDDWYIL